VNSTTLFSLSCKAIPQLGYIYMKKLSFINYIAKLLVESYV